MERRLEALVFDGNNIWVADQQSDSLMKLRASEGLNLGTLDTGRRPVALTYDGTHFSVANKMSNNVMKFLTKDDSLVSTIPVCQQIEPRRGAVINTFKVAKSPSSAIFDGTNIWVANGGVNSVSRLSL